MLLLLLLLFCIVFICIIEQTYGIIIMSHEVCFFIKLTRLYAIIYISSDPIGDVLSTNNIITNHRVYALKGESEFSSANIQISCNLEKYKHQLAFTLSYLFKWFSIKRQKHKQRIFVYKKNLLLRKEVS